MENRIPLAVDIHRRSERRIPSWRYGMTYRLTEVEPGTSAFILLDWDAGTNGIRLAVGPSGTST